MKKCKSCQTEIDAKAKKCPHCQTDQRSWFLRHPIWSGIGGLFLLGIVGSALGSGKSGSKSETSAPTQTTTGQQVVQPTNIPSPTPRLPTKLNTVAWIGEYDKNKLSANEKYKGAYVEFTAKIQNISESFGKPYLSLEPVSTSTYFGTSINCEFTSAEPLKSLENGKTVTVRGTVGEQSFGIIPVKDCEVVR